MRVENLLGRLGRMTYIAHRTNSMLTKIATPDAEEILKMLSDSDWIRVVRCRDCVKWKAPTKVEQADGETFGYCKCRFGMCYGQKTDMNWFCADGERKK